jgi:hypothetical protein
VRPYLKRKKEGKKTGKEAGWKEGSLRNINES